MKVAYERLDTGQIVRTVAVGSERGLLGVVTWGDGRERVLGMDQIDVPQPGALGIPPPCDDGLPLRIFDGDCIAVECDRAVGVTKCADAEEGVFKGGHDMARGGNVGWDCRDVQLGSASAAGGLNSARGRAHVCRGRSGIKSCTGASGAKYRPLAPESTIPVWCRRSRRRWYLRRYQFVRVAWRHGRAGGRGRVGLQPGGEAGVNNAVLSILFSMLSAAPAVPPRQALGLHPGGCLLALASRG